jgi:putative redox protein
MSEVALKWTGEDSQMFIGRDSFGHVVISGSWPNVEPGWQEWRGLKPSDLLLLSLAACAAHDVVLILKRMRQQLTGLYIAVQGHQLSRPPYTFTDIHCHCVFDGYDLDPVRCQRAVNLSVDKYCSVAATIRATARLTHSLEVRSKEPANPPAAE